MEQPIDTNWMDTPEVLSVVFHPRREYGEAPGDDEFTVLDIPVADAVSVGGRFHETGKDRPNMLFFHGNGEIVADYADISRLYTSMDINFLPVDYRPVGAVVRCFERPVLGVPAGRVVGGSERVGAQLAFVRQGVLNTCLGHSNAEFRSRIPVQQVFHAFTAHGANARVVADPAAEFRQAHDAAFPVEHPNA